MTWNRIVHLTLKEFIMENNIIATNVNYSGELIFDNDYFDDGYDITYKQNSISKIIDGFYIGDTYVNTSTERYQLSLF